MSKIILPAPVCQVGYPVAQVVEILGDLKPAFDKWFTGQTGGICEGKVYNHGTGNHEPSGCGPHGFAVYTWDLKRWVDRYNSKVS